MIVWLPKLYNHQLIKPYIKIVSFLLELISITFTNCIVSSLCTKVQLYIIMYKQTRDFNVAIKVEMASSLYYGSLALGQLNFRWFPCFPSWLLQISANSCSCYNFQKRKWYRYYVKAQGN